MPFNLLHGYRLKDEFISSVNTQNTDFLNIPQTTVQNTPQTAVPWIYDENGQHVNIPPALFGDVLRLANHYKKTHDTNTYNQIEFYY